MQPGTIQKLRSACPDLLDWDGVEVQTIKDPRAPMSIVSDQGVAYGGIEPDSAVHRLTAGGRSVILKQHFAAEPFRRETANIAFVNHAGGFAPELHHVDAEAGLVLMEDVGGDSMAVLWANGMMDEYTRWAYEAVDVVVAVQLFHRDHAELLEELYGGPAPERGPVVSLPEGLPAALDAILEMSRGSRLSEADHDALRQWEDAVTVRVRRFSERHRTFSQEDLNAWHVIRKDGRIRVIDLTGAPIGPLLFHLENAVWHLEDRRQILHYYLDRRETSDLPGVDRDEFMFLEDAMHALSCLDWAGRYCRAILGDELAFRGMDGSRVNDYAGSEADQLAAIRRGLAPHDGHAVVLEIVDRYFALPLLGC